LNIGELVVNETSFVPSKLSPLENFMSRGTIVTGTVVVADPLAGLVPTIVYDHVFPSDLKDEVHVASPPPLNWAWENVWWNRANRGVLLTLEVATV